MNALLFAQVLGFSGWLTFGIACVHEAVRGDMATAWDMARWMFGCVVLLAASAWWYA